MQGSLAVDKYASKLTSLQEKFQVLPICLKFCVFVFLLYFSLDQGLWYTALPKCHFLPKIRLEDLSRGERHIYEIT